MNESDWKDMKENEFKRDLAIDPENLEAEAATQPELYFKYASLAREAREEQDKAKLNFELCSATLSQQVRTNPGGYGIRKPTEGSITEAVKAQAEYEVAYKDFIKAKSEADILLKAQEAMDQRKRMIELLVQLYSREYFAGPSMPHSPEQFWDEIKKKKGEKTHEKMVKRTKKKIRRRKTNE